MQGKKSAGRLLEWQPERRKLSKILNLPKVAAETYSAAQLVAMLDPQEIDEFMGDLTNQEVSALAYDWGFWGRPKQFAPTNIEWYIWLILSGRGFGKTRTGAELLLEKVRQGTPRIALVGKTKADVRDTMIEVGPAAILNVAPPDIIIDYQPSKRRLNFPDYGTVVSIYSGDEPDQLRGPAHDWAWVDELAKFKYPDQAMENLEMGLREGDNPQIVITTTPRPIPIIIDMVKDAQGKDPDTVITTGSSYENVANLAPAFIRRVIKKYEGTRRGRQEIHGQILEDAAGALWSRDMIERNRVTSYPEMIYIVTAIDPQASVAAEHAETGIITGGLGVDGLAYILEDSSLSARPAGWATAAITSYNRWQANIVVGEANNGGDMVENAIITIAANEGQAVAYKKIWASRGKATRAEPISMLSEKDKLKFVGGFPDLEDELCQWEPGTGAISPNRLDALVWAIHHLFFDELEGGGDDSAYNDFDEYQISPY